MTAQAKTVEPRIVNGINLDDLFALIDSAKRGAAQAKTNWRVTTTWQGQARSRAQVEGFEIGGERVPRRVSIDIDEPCELGGPNPFANPQEHLLAALRGCLAPCSDECLVGDRARQFDRGCGDDGYRR